MMILMKINTVTRADNIFFGDTWGAIWDHLKFVNIYGTA